MTLEDVRIAYARLRHAAENGEPIDPPRLALIEAIDGLEAPSRRLRSCRRDLAEDSASLLAMPEILEDFHLRMFDQVDWRSPAAWQEPYPLYTEPTPKQLAAIPDYKHELYRAYAKLRHVARGRDESAIDCLRVSLRSALVSFRVRQCDLPRAGLEEAEHRLMAVPIEAVAPEFVESLEPFILGGAEPDAPSIGHRESAIGFLRQLIPHANQRRVILVREALQKHAGEVDAQERLLAATFALPSDVVQGFLESPVEAVREWARAVLNVTQ